MILKKVHSWLRHKLYPYPITFVIKDGDTAGQVVDRASKITDDGQFFSAVSLLCFEWVTMDIMLDRHDIWDRVKKLWKEGFRNYKQETDEVVALITLLDLEPKERS